MRKITLQKWKLGTYIWWKNSQVRKIAVSHSCLRYSTTLLARMIYPKARRWNWSQMPTPHLQTILWRIHGALWGIIYWKAIRSCCNLWMNMNAVASYSFNRWCRVMVVIVPKVKGRRMWKVCGTSMPSLHRSTDIVTCTNTSSEVSKAISFKVIT